MKEKDILEKPEKRQEPDLQHQQTTVPPILEEITIEELAVDGICGIY
jgi:mycofactocin precursor